MLLNCSVCNEIKDLSDFYRSKKYKSGYSPHCKTCFKKLFPPKKRTPKIYQDYEIITPDIKVCSHCKIAKSYLEFYTSKRYKTGLMSRCKECHALTSTPHKYKQYRLEEIQPSATKVCKDCNQTKNIEDFYVSRDRKSGVNPRCKVCYNIKYPPKKEVRRQYFEANKDKYTDNRLWRTYGITLNEYENMLSVQNHRCKICKISIEDLNRRLDVDHCHETGKIRGLLCNKCNQLLGLANHDITILNNVIEYLSEL